MATDPAVTLRRVLVELRALRVRINRQIAAVERTLQPSTRPKTAKTASARKAKSAKQSAPRVQSVGYSRDRQTLTRRLSRKDSR